MTAQDHTRFEDLLPAFVLGALDGDDLRSLEAHLRQGCAECERLQEEWRQTLEALAESVEPVPPSRMARARLLKSLPSHSRRARSTSWPVWGLLAASVAAVVMSSALYLRQLGLERHLERSLSGTYAYQDKLAGDLARVHDDLDAVRFQSCRLASTVQELSAPNTRSVALASLEEAGAAVGCAFVRPNDGGAVFYAYDLPALPTGKTYQLWTIAGGVPRSAGIFDIGQDGQGRIEVLKDALVDEIQVWAVTIEPAGGVPQPTGEMVLKS